jgi:hypothetical protein
MTAASELPKAFGGAISPSSSARGTSAATESTTGTSTAKGKRLPEAALFVDLSRIDRVAIAKRGHIQVMVTRSEILTREEFNSLLTVGNTSAVSDPPAVIPAEHSARLIALGYMADLAGRFRMTTPGRQRIAAGFEIRPPLVSN